MTVGHTGVTPQAIGPCGDDDCGIRDVLDRIGDKWSVLVVVELAKGVRRFRELQRAVPGISQRMLTLTLRLWGNVFGGEIMLVVMSGLLLLPGLALPFVGLEVFIGLVQGLVFALLVLMYFILAIESHDEEHEEGSQADTDRVPSPEMHPRPAAST